MAKRDGVITRGVATTLLGIGTAGAIHAAVSPSFFTFGAFARDPEKKKLAQDGLYIGLGLGAITTIGIHLAFKDTIATIATGASFLLFAGLGFWRLGMNGVENPSMLPDNVPATETDATRRFQST